MFSRFCLRAAAVGGGATTLYAGSHYNRFSAKCESTPPTFPADKTDQLKPSFKAILLSKVYKMDFRELQKPEVWIEIGLISIPLAIAAITSGRILLTSKRSWSRREFYNVLNISLNTVVRSQTTPHTYSLYFRTILEKELTHIIPNTEGVKQLVEAAKRTNDENPFVVIKNGTNHWTVCNQIANQISSLCAPSFIHRDIMCKDGISRDACNVACEHYLMALTCEPEKTVRNSKIRVMLIQERIVKQLAEDMSANEGEHSEDEFWMAKLEDPLHAARWDLIKKIVNTYRVQPKRKNAQIVWGKPLCDIELCAMPACCKL